MVAHQNGSDKEGMALSEAHTTPAKKPSQEAISSSKHLFSGANCYFQGLYLHPTLLFILHPEAIFFNQPLFVCCWRCPTMPHQKKIPSRRARTWRVVSNVFNLAGA